MTHQPAETVRVMIVEDQPPFRSAAKAVVDRVAGFVLVADVASGRRPSSRAPRSSAISC